MQDEQKQIEMRCCVLILVFVSASMTALLSPQYRCSSDVQRNPDEWKRIHTHTYNMDTWPCDRKSLDNTQTEKWAHNRISNWRRTVLVERVYVRVRAWKSTVILLRPSSQAGSCPANPPKCPPLSLQAHFFFFKRQMHYLRYLRIASLSDTVYFCCEWVNQRVKNSSLSLSPLYVYISVQRGAVEGGHFRSKRLRPASDPQQPPVAVGEDRTHTYTAQPFPV